MNFPTLTKPWLQAAALMAIACSAAIGTRLVQGPPQRMLACDPTKLKADEICLQSIPKHIEVVWIDARSRRDWQRDGMPGSLLWNLDPDEDMQAFEAEVAMQVAQHPYAVVYCGDEQCGTSRQIADRIRRLGLDAEIRVLHGGWRALHQAGLIRPTTRRP